MSELELIAGAVYGFAAAGATRIATAPFDAVAEHWKERIKARLDRTCAVAETKARGCALEVPDRVAYKVLIEAAFSDDAIVADYLGGVLAASARDDEGAAIVAQIGRLSALQLRIHYMTYRAVSRLWPRGHAIDLYSDHAVDGVRFTKSDLSGALGIDGPTEIFNALPVLRREGLIGGKYQVGTESSYVAWINGSQSWTFDGPSNWSARLRPSASGAQLFLWGLGRGSRDANDLVAIDDADFIADVPDTPDVTLLSRPRLVRRR